MSTSTIVSTYNILSSQLCSPSHFSKTEPAHLDKDNRWTLIQRTLNKFIVDNHIICLQEVCVFFREKLTMLFENAGYAVIENSYGSRFNGFMGCMTAYPKQLYRLEEVKFINPSLLYKHEPEYHSPTILLRGLNLARSLLWMNAMSVETQQSRDTAKMFDTTNNHFIFTKFSCTVDNTAARRTFSVTNLHMPCKYFTPMFMNKYVALFVDYIRAIQPDHWIICGDFNSTTSDSWFQPLTQFKMVGGDRITSLNDAQEYSNVSFSGGKLFKGKIDYIFHSDSFCCHSFTGYTTSENTAPNAEQGSDHFPITAEFKLN